MTALPDFDNRIDILGLTEEQGEFIAWLMIGEPMDTIKLRFDAGLALLNRGFNGADIVKEMSANTVYLKARYKRRQENVGDNPIDIKKRVEDDPWAVKRKPKSEPKHDKGHDHKPSQVHDRAPPQAINTSHPADHERPFSHSVAPSATAKKHAKSRLDAIRQELQD